MDTPFRNLEEHAALKHILEGTSRETGLPFFRALVKSLAAALDVHGAWVTELNSAARRLDAYALWIGGEFVDGYRYSIPGTPCEEVVSACHVVHVADNVVDLYPGDPDLRSMGAVSYLGVPLVDDRGEVVGNLAVLDRRPMPRSPRALAIIQIFAARAAAEVARLRAEATLRSREAQVRGLVDSALDAILQLDAELRIVRANPAAERTFRTTSAALVGKPFADFLADESAGRLRRHIDALIPADARRRAAWVSGGLNALRADRSPFPAEASVSRFETGPERFTTVILRDLDERREAERRIESLSRETQVLREDLRAAEGTGEILGDSPPLRALMADVDEVAATDATVLIEGETGTGKELVARAIHARGSRRGRPLVRLNCGAVPAALLESELFGHEKGAFTGATSRRDGRFLLADRGTLFLDEVGELTLELQVKLLRVLQEGEFEPVGSSGTVKVDVRIVAATNRDLAREVKEGRFREDLYYRLNVFPLRVPPLRDRKEDIPVLAEAFARRVAARIGRRVEGLRPEDAARLRAGDWPGNVRELHNVIERAVITSRGGRLNLDRALGPAAAFLSEEASAGDVRTVRDLEDLERRNLLRALERTGGKVSGKDGAAALLGMKPSTLNSRMKALGVRRDR